jgi:uncharacterized damage-inducible protein DinB
MKKQDILNELITARADLLDAIDGLTPEQLRQPFAVGIWSVKDVLAHLAAWESELVTALNQAQGGGRPPQIVLIDDIDEWNEEQYHVSARRPLEAILDDLHGVHDMLRQMVEGYPDKRLLDNRQFEWMEGEALAYLIGEDAYLHESEHAEQIRTWRKQTGI